MNTKKSKYGKIILLTSLVALFGYLLLAPEMAFAQSGNAFQKVGTALSSQVSQGKNFYQILVTVIQMVAAFTGLVGIVVIYQKWNAGDPNTGKFVGGFLGGVIFLFIAAEVLRASFIQ